MGVSSPVWYRVAAVWIVAFGLLLVALTASLWVYQATAQVSALREAQALGAEEVPRIEARLREHERHVQDLAEELEKGDLDIQEIPDRVMQVAEAEPEILGLGAGFLPFRGDPDRRLLSYYAVREPGPDPILVQLEDVYDYTEAPWYDDAIATAPAWQEPFFGEATQAMVSMYCAPFTLPQHQAMSGLVCATLDLEQVARVVRRLHLGPTGFGFLLSKEQRVVAHPVFEHVRQERTLREVADRFDPSLHELADEIEPGRAGSIRLVSEETAEPTWFVFEPVNLANWTLVVEFDEARLLPGVAATQRLRMAITLAAVGLLLGVMGLWVTSTRRTLFAMWASSAMISVTMAGATAMLWNLERQAHGWEHPGVVEILDRGDLEAYLHSFERDREGRRLPVPDTIPTGVLVESVVFRSPHELVVTGHVWHRRPVEVEVSDDGVRFPDQLHLLDKLELLRQIEVDDRVVTLWRFKTTLFRATEPVGYPIDTRTVSLRLWHSDVESPVILSPDLGAYPVLIPTEFPGVDPDFQVPGWTPRRSFYGFRRWSGETDFGLPGSQIASGFPELSFNIVLQRNLANALVGHLLPHLVATVIIFGMLIIDTQQRDRASAFGFLPIRILTGASAIFFVLVLNHFRLRQEVETPQVVYLELFYFVAYVLILGVGINALLLTSKFQVRVLRLQDNLVPKLLFWPFATGSIFVLTAWFFY